MLASLIGLDRERRESSAGLRTHALVGMSAGLLMIASVFGFADILRTPHVTLDPSRIAAQIVSGIGFLGAGAIIARGSLVRGLTTAASVWTVAAVGLTVGGRMYIAAFFALEFHSFCWRCFALWSGGLTAVGANKELPLSTILRQFQWMSFWPLYAMQTCTFLNSK